MKFCFEFVLNFEELGGEESRKISHKILSYFVLYDFNTKHDQLDNDEVYFFGDKRLGLRCTKLKIC